MGLRITCPPVHIYHSKLWDTNYVARFYDICERFLSWVYFLIFNKEDPMFSPEAKALIATMGYYYVGEYFTYIRVYGKNEAHMFPKVIPDRLVLEEISFQIVTEEIYKKCAAPKRKVWPRFPITLGSLSVPSSTWALELSDHIMSLKIVLHARGGTILKGLLIYT